MTTKEEVILSLPHLLGENLFLSSQCPPLPLPPICRHECNVQLSLKQKRNDRWSGTTSPWWCTKGLFILEF